MRLKMRAGRAGAAGALGVISAVGAAVLGLAACSAGQTGGAPRTPDTEALDALRVKVAALRVDQCQQGDPALVYPACGRYVTEVADTVASLRVALAGRSGADSGAATLQSSVDQYQRLGCDQADPPADRCAAALASIRGTLSRLGDDLAGPGGH